MDAINAIIEFENTRVLDGVGDGCAFNAETVDTFAYTDLVEIRQIVKGPIDYDVLHPNEMGANLSDRKFLRVDIITTIDRVRPSTTPFQTKLGTTIYETEHRHAPPSALHSRRRRPAAEESDGSEAHPRGGDAGGRCGEADCNACARSPRAMPYPQPSSCGLRCPFGDAGR